jgi:hypothetical protein
MFSITPPQAALMVDQLVIVDHVEGEFLAAHQVSDVYQLDLKFGEPNLLRHLFDIDPQPGSRIAIQGDAAGVLAGYDGARCKLGLFFGLHAFFSPDLCPKGICEISRKSVIVF